MILGHIDTAGGEHSGSVLTDTSALVSRYTGFSASIKPSSSLVLNDGILA